MFDQLISAVRLSKFLHLGYRSLSDNQWDTLLDSLEAAKTLARGSR